MVPYLGLYLTDLTFIEDGNPDFVTEDGQQMINLAKVEGWTGLDWRLGSALGWAGGWAGGWTGLGWAGLGWAGIDVELGWAELGKGWWGGVEGSRDQYVGGRGVVGRR